MQGFCRKQYRWLVAHHALIQCRQPSKFLISNDLRVIEHVRPFTAVAALEEIAEPEKKKGRLSRKERAAFVESFVNSHRASNGGDFPSVSLVVKTTGCSPQIAKKISDQLLSKDLDSDVGIFPLAAQESSSTLEMKVTFCGNSEEQDDLVIDQSSSGASITSEVKMTSCGKSKSKDGSETDQSTSVVNSEDGVGNLVRVEDRPAVKNVQEQSGESISAKNERVAKPENLSKQGRRVTSPKPKTRKTFASRRMIESAGKEIQTIYPISEQIRAINFSASNPYSQHQAANSARLERRSKLLANQYKFSSRKQTGQMSGSIKGTSYKLGVGNLDLMTTDEDLRDSFRDCGAIIKEQVFHEKSSSGKPLVTSGLVCFKTQGGLNKALQKESPKIRGREVDLFPLSSKTRALSIQKRTSVRSLFELSSSKVNEKQSATKTPLPFSSVECSAKSEPVIDSVLQISTESENFKCAVLVENLPAGFSTFQVKEALSRHGEVTGSYVGVGEHGGGGCFVEFKNEEDMENALSLQQVSIAGHLACIRRVSLPNTPVVRVSNVSPDTKISSIYSLCQLYGEVRTVDVKKGGVMDIHFESSERTNMLEILDRLNEVTMDQSSWQARPAPMLAPETFRSHQTTEKGRKFLLSTKKLGIYSTLSNLRDLVINIEDLNELYSDFLTILRASIADIENMSEKEAGDE